MFRRRLFQILYTYHVYFKVRPRFIHVYNIIWCVFIIKQVATMHVSMGIENTRENPIIVYKIFKNQLFLNKNKSTSFRSFLGVLVSVCVEFIPRCFTYVCIMFIYYHYSRPIIQTQMAEKCLKYFNLILIKYLYFFSYNVAFRFVGCLCKKKSFIFFS